MLIFVRTIVSEIFAFFFPSNLLPPVNLDLVHLAAIGSYYTYDHINIREQRMAQVRACIRAQARNQANTVKLSSTLQCRPSRREPPAASILSLEILHQILVYLLPPSSISVSAVEGRLDADIIGYDKLGEGWQERLLYANIPAPHKLPNLRDLTRALKVCRKWYVSGVDLLWRMPRFSSPQSYMKFSAFLHEQARRNQASPKVNAKRKHHELSCKYDEFIQLCNAVNHKRVRIFDISHWHNTPELKELISQTDLQLLPSIMSNLSVLSFAGLRALTEATLAICLTSIRLKPGLARLDLSGCVNITDASISLISLLHGHSLRWLSLEGCSRITDRGLYTLVGSVLPETSTENTPRVIESVSPIDSGIGCLNLRHLNVSGCSRITENGMIKAVSRLRLNTLQMLNCYGIDNDNIPNILARAGPALHHVACNIPFTPVAINQLFMQLFQLSELRYLLLEVEAWNTRRSLSTNAREECQRLLLHLPTQCPNLISLELYNALYIPPPVNVIEDWLVRMPKLQMLRICGAPGMMHDCVNTISRVCGHRLFLLDISDSIHMRVSGFKHIVLPSLKGLILRNLSIRQTDLVDLLNQCPNLRGIDISDCRVISEDRLVELDLPAIEQISRPEIILPSLTNTAYHCKWCRIGEEGCKLLRVWTSMNKIL
ncbi:hypothetical protein BDF22DRAFT_700209 [Syncephalis plumigaleata]|nr:hypothetical protein BDF22DRAFT_700209 [Syncephalis plumigaleata]